MKILQTPTRFYPYAGGIENYVYNLSKELIKLGHQVKVICANDPPVGNKAIEGIAVKRLRYISRVANANITLGLPKELFNEDFDVAHTHLPSPWSADWSAIISLIKAKPLILTYHNNIVGRGINLYTAKVYNFTLLSILLRSAKKIIITHKRYLDYSPYLKGYLKKIEVIPVGVDLRQFRALISKREQQKSILFIGVLDEFHRYKGLDYLILAMDLIRKQIPDVRLTVVGEGSLKEEYVKLAKSLRLDEQIDFAGFVDPQNLVEYYNNCDIFVLPSISSEQEGFGMVLLEAMSCAKPVVTTNITGLAEEIKETKSGIVIEPKDVNSLTKAILEILRDQNYAQEMGRRARQLTEIKYSWNSVAAQIERLYTKAIS